MEKNTRCIRTGVLDGLSVVSVVEEPEGWWHGDYNSKR
jgi:hypothetical protein